MYSGLREAERWVLPAVIEEQAARLEDKPVVSMVGGGTLSYRELDDAAARVAGMLHDQGVRPGDRVAIMVPSGPDFLRAWAGVGRLGAVAVVLHRSEEHTSELPSIMRSSYAVFCLTKTQTKK